MKTLQSFISQIFRKRKTTAQSALLKVDRLKQRILPKRYLEDDEGSLFI